VAVNQTPPGGWPIPRSAYVHVPFCRHRCGYCNFSVLAGRDDLADEFVTAIHRELSGLNNPREIDTLFLGGGTPTHLSLGQLDSLFDAIDQWLPRSPGAEVSVEANPEDIEPAKLRLLAARGVNRISLGVQSFGAEKLKTLERSHNAALASDAIRLASETIGNVSIDLIFGSPGETVGYWTDDLKTALSLPIRHLSTYALTFEKGTSFWTDRLRGNLSSIGEDDELAMYETAIQMARARGLEHYEISSFAEPGARCRHNIAYWQGRGWYAFGPGAARFVDGNRDVNHRSTTTYLHRIKAGRSPVAQSETLTLQQYASERAAFGIRMIDGIDLRTISNECGVDIETLRARDLTRCIDQGLVVIDRHVHRLTQQGIRMADTVASALLG